MSTVSVGLQPDVSSVSSNSASVSNNAFGGIMDGLSLVSGAFGTAAVAGLTTAGDLSGAAIASATSSAVYGSSTALAGGSTLGLTNGANYYGGTTMGLTSGTGYSTTGSLNTDVESILAETATSQSYLIGIQAMMGQQQSTFTAISNALNVKYSMERSAIQNFRS